MPEGPRVVLVAGETSGDMHGAELVRALRRIMPGLKASGIGGPAMAAEGVDILFPAEDLALMGISEVLPRLRVIWRSLKGMRRHLAQAKPDLLILIDFPDFNFRLGKSAHKLGVKVLYYVCPQVWAWRQKRAAAMARFVDRLACILTFEPEFLAPLAPGLEAKFVGHPLLDHPSAPEPDANPLPVPRDGTLVGILPGSRHSEVSRILPVILEAARVMRARREGLHFILPLAPGINQKKVDPILKKAPPGLTVVRGRADEVMRQSRALIVASGTATLQAALAGAPMVVVYKTGGFNYRVARLMIKVEFIAMPNLIAGRRVVPELIQGEARPQAIAEETLALLDDGPARLEMLQGLAHVKERMGGPGASQEVARMAQEMIEEK